MTSTSRSSGAPDMVSFGDVLFLLALVLFLAVVCMWPVLAWRIHHFSTWVPTATHSFPVHDRMGQTVYLNPTFGKFYVSLPWLWCGALAATILASALASKSTER